MRYQPDDRWFDLERSSSAERSPRDDRARHVAGMQEYDVYTEPGVTMHTTEATRSMRSWQGMQWEGGDFGSSILIFIDSSYSIHHY